MPLASHVYFEELNRLVWLTDHLEAALLNFCVNQLVGLSPNLKMPGGSMHPFKGWLQRTMTATQGDH